MKGQYWGIIGIDGQNTIFQTTIPASEIAEKQIKVLLKILVAKYGLGPEEICDSCKREKTKGFKDLLKVEKSYNPYQYYTVIGSPDFYAILKPILKPKGIEYEGE